MKPHNHNIGMMTIMDLQIINGMFSTNGVPVLRGYGSMKCTCDAVKNAIGCGYRFIDSAFAYGNAKEIVEGFNSMGLNGQDIVIASKIPGNALNKSDLSGSTLKCMNEIRGSFYPYDVNVIYLHGPECIQPEVLNIVTNEYSGDNGKYFGLSNVDRHTIDRVIKKGFKVHTIQNEFNPYYWDRELLDYCRENGIVYVGYRPFGDKYKNEILNHPILLSIAKELECNVSCLILQWINQKGVMPIPHSNSEGNIKKNINGGCSQISDKHMRMIDEIRDEKNRKQTCNWEKFTDKELLKMSQLYLI